MAFFNHWKDEFQGHICGCYIVLTTSGDRTYLPQVKMDSRTTITSIHSITNLRQVFFYPNQSEESSEVRYCFPLYDGVTVCAYSIKFADKHLVGVVQQKDDARTTYNNAVDRGEAAGLLESLPAGVFGVTLGNIPADTEITVEISYTGELKHDAGIDGLRYILPTRIAPRYGAYPSKILESNIASKGGINITVDVDVGDSSIRKIQSPSHPIAVTLGSTSLESASSEFASSRASASLALGSAELDKDFILQLLIDDINKTQALLETHSTLPDQRAILATLVPKFTLPPADPEIVFIADQSGSMTGQKNTALINSLKVFIKSLPFNVRFNICAFGSNFDYLWPKSQPYSEENVDKALEFIKKFSAHLGGTEILPPLTAAFEQRLKDMPLEVMLLTDGEVWGENDIFEFINSKVRGTASENATDARVFSLGIGSDVSHTLVEGVARAGNGFSQFVVDGEDVDKKIIRMLKGALSAHTTNYSAEVNFGDDGNEMKDDSDDFELVEKVEAVLKIVEDKDETGRPTRSFFDESSKDSDEGNKKERYAHLPEIHIPPILSAPSEISPLYSFSRTTLYLLLGPDAPQKAIKSITIRAKSKDIPLELTVPVHDLGKGTALHQLAARRAVQELEEGRGWLHKAKILSKDGSLGEGVQEKYPSRLDEFTEREAVRLGVQFQVASKWTSFVAVQEGSRSENIAPSTFEEQPKHGFATPSPQGEFRRRVVARFGATAPAAPPPPPGRAPAPAPALPAAAFANPGTVDLCRNPVQKVALGGLSRKSLGEQLTSSWGGSSWLSKKKKTSSRPPQVESALDCIAMALPPAPSVALSSSMQFDSFTHEDEDSICDSQSSPNKLRAIIDAQKFSGLWEQDTKLLQLLGMSDHGVDVFGKRCPEISQSSTGVEPRQAYATLLVIAWLKKNHNDDKEVWDMVAEKATSALERGWGLTSPQIENMLRTACACLPS